MAGSKAANSEKEVQPSTGAAISGILSRITFSLSPVPISSINPNVAGAILNGKSEFLNGLNFRRNGTNLKLNS